MTQALRRARLHPRFPHKIGVTAALTIAADFLFFDRPPGISAALFMLLLAGGVWYVNRLQFRDPAVRSALILTGAGCLALIENVSWLSGAFALAGLVSLATPHRARWHRDGVRWLEELLKFVRRGWLRPFKDARIYRRVFRKNRCGPVRKHQFIGWVLPLGASLVFLGLFADANPIISDWLAAITDFESPNPGRVFFWLAAAFLCWPFIRPRLARFGPVSPALYPDLVPAVSWAVDSLFSTGAIVRSLIIFNAMFAVQTVLDATYLWGGQALPDGMTYAQYAHRGAYPLAAVALLAAGFVLIAMRPGSESAREPFVRNLVYGWVAQTIVLVGASIWRTGLYVSVYSLTYLRVAAVVWMILVAAGLVWIVLRLMLNRTNAWLIKVNLLTAMGVLYIFCFVEVGGTIARFNVEQDPLAGQGVYKVDFDYLEEIGPAALPALDRYLAEVKAKWSRSTEQFDVELMPARMLRSRLAWRLAERHRDWRGYTFRSYRLALDVAKSRAEIYDTPARDGEWTVE